MSLTYRFIASRDVIFKSNWDTATGTSQNATGDGDIWDVRNFAPNVLEVVNASNEGLSSSWPTTNALRVSGEDNGLGGCNAEKVAMQPGAWPIPGVGKSLFYRWYEVVSSEFCIGSGPNDHPILDDWVGVSGSGSDWAHQYQTGNGFYTTDVRSYGTSAPNDIWHLSSGGVLTQLSDDTVYRREMRITRLSSTTYTMSLRIYDGSGTLLYDDNDFENADQSLTLDSQPTLTFDGVQLDQLHFGVAAISPSEVTSAGLVFPFIIYYWGAVAVATDTWIGAYPLLSVET